ncbi:transcriptional regulator [Sulfolobales archaeon HS-7]|nr:transcriptional regulator [Sulfolobales archaeon HS-7]
MEQTIDIQRLRESRDAIRCCFQITDTDVDCFLRLIQIGGKATSEELAKNMNLSKTTVESSLKKLIEVGLVERHKVEDRKVGRPKYNYVLKEDILSVVRSGLSNCSKKFQAVI